MSQSEEVRVFAMLFALPGKEDEVRRNLAEFVPLTKAEPGCLTYMLHEGTGQPGTFCFYEVYKNAEAAEAHAKSAHLAAILEKNRPLLSAPPTIIVTKLLTGS
jgi:quinol monooxygenase YgiN